MEMEGSELILKHGELNWTFSQLQELASASSQNLAQAAINIENSSDVIIGPVTQFNGPVTIYQNDTPSIIEASKPPVSEEAPKKNNAKCLLIYSRPYLKFGIISILLTILIITVTCVILFVYKVKEHSDKNTDNNNEAGYDGAYIYRSTWGGRPPKYTKPLQHPTPLVIISHTVSPFCTNIQECSMYVRSAQEHHVGTFDQPDIGYNFLIGGDANVYVGRGWDTLNFHRNDSIGVCFIGNYLYDELNDNMITSLKNLLKLGVENGKLSKTYKLIGHNQTTATQSPGKNVYKVIKQWDHFIPGTFR